MTLLVQQGHRVGLTAEAKVEGGERRLDVVEFLHLCRAMGAEPASFFENI